MLVGFVLYQQKRVGAAIMLLISMSSGEDRIK